MKIERAIQILDPNHREYYESIDPVNEACRMGMEALQEKLYRSGGCDWCKSLEKKPDDFTLGDLRADRYVRNTFIGDGFTYFLTAMFCPICGRDLHHIRGGDSEP